MDPKGLESFDPFTGIPKDFMKPFYNWLDKTFGDKPKPPPSVFDKIYDGLSRDIPKMYDNAHPAARMCLDIALTGVEAGLTGGLSPFVTIPYDIYSGANFNTLPLSPSGWLGNQLTTPLY